MYRDFSTSVPLFSRIASGNKGSLQLEAFPRLWHGFSRLGSRNSGCLVQRIRRKQAPRIAHLTRVNEYLHVPSVSRQEFNKAKSRRREPEVGRMRCVASRCVTCVHPRFKRATRKRRRRQSHPTARSLTRARSLVTLPLPTPVNSGHNYRALL